MNNKLYYQETNADYAGGRNAASFCLQTHSKAIETFLFGCLNCSNIVGSYKPYYLHSIFDPYSNKPHVYVFFVHIGENTN